MLFFVKTTVCNYIKRKSSSWIQYQAIFLLFCIFKLMAQYTNTIFIYSNVLISKNHGLR